MVKVPFSRKLKRQVSLITIVFLFLQFFNFSSSNFSVNSAKASTSDACGVDYTSNDLTVTPSHGKVFYIDTGITPILNSGYIGYNVSNSSNTVKSGYWVKISNFLGGKLQLANADDEYFKLPDLPAAKTITNKQLTSNVATLTTSSAHGFSVGDPVTIIGVDSTFNGTYNVNSVPTTTTFTYVKTATNVSSTAVNTGVRSVSIVKTAYFYLNASSASTSAQTHDIDIYATKPDTSGATSNFTCRFSFNKVQETIKAAANKVEDIDGGSSAAITLSDSTPELGQIITLTIEGATGQVGNGSAPDYDMIWFTPSAISSWPTRALRLESTSITIDKDGKWSWDGGGTTNDQKTIVNQLFVPDASEFTGSQSEYKAVYTFRVIGRPAASVSAVPITQISSGTQVKHADTTGAGSTATLSFTSFSTNYTLSKTVVDAGTPSTTTIGSTNYVSVRYKLTATSTSSTETAIDEIVDTPSTSAVFNTSFDVKLNDIYNTTSGGVTISDPITLSSESGLSPPPLHFPGPFYLKSGTTAEITYEMWIPQTTGTYSNTAFIRVGDLKVGASASTIPKVTVTTNGTTTVTSSTSTESLTVDAVTQPATSIATTSATLNATIDPNGVGGTAQFEWGTDPTLATKTTTATSTPASGTLSGSDPIAASLNLTGLNSGTTYYFRIKVGTVFGDILSFVTIPVSAPPTATTQSATSITHNSATLNGAINPNLTNVTAVQFVYGTNSSLSSGNTTYTFDDGSGVAYSTAGGLSESFTLDLTGLSAGTTYYFKIVACTASSGTYPSITCSSSVSGSILSFTTTSLYTVTFDANSGTGSSSVSSVTQASGGASVTLATQNTLTRSGFVFGGWNTLANGSGTNYNSSDSYTPVSNITLYAKWNPVYTVTFDANGGTGSASVSSVTQNTFGGSVTLASLGTLAKSGYTFSGWQTTPSGGTTYSASSSYTPGANVTLYAIWTQNTYNFTVNYFPGTNGSGTMSSQTGTAATVTLTPNSFTHATSGVFSGWATSDGGSIVYSNSQTITLTSTTTLNLYAIWDTSGVKYTVTFNGNSQTTGSPSANSLEQSVAGGSVTLATQNTLTRTGFVFGGWNTASNGSGSNYNASSSYTPSGNITLYAKWNPVYTITFDANGGTGTAVATSLTQATYEGSITLTDKGTLAKSGYVFGGWNEASNGSGTNYEVSSTKIPVSNITLYAKWNPVYTVTFDINGGSGSASVSNVTQNTFGGSVTLATQNTLTRTGFVFGGWNTASNGTGSNSSAGSSYNPGSSITLYAKWDPVYTVTFNANGGSGSASVSSVTQTSNGGNVTLASSGTLSYSGYVFDGWNTQSDGNGTDYSQSSTYTPVVNITLYAVWLEVFTVTFDANGGSGSASVVNVSQTIQGGSVNLASVGSLERSGYSFAGWQTTTTGGTAYSANATYVPTSNITLYARWTINTNSGTSGGGGTRTTTPSPTPTPTPSPTSTRRNTSNNPTIRRSPVTTPQNQLPSSPSILQSPHPQPTPTTRELPVNPAPNVLALVPQTPNNPINLATAKPTGTVENGSGKIIVAPETLIPEIETFKNFIQQFNNSSASSSSNSNSQNQGVKRNVTELAHEKIVGFNPNEGIKIEVIGARATAQFIVSPTTVSDPIVVAAAIRESTARTATDFARVENAIPTSAPVSNATLVAPRPSIDMVQRFKESNLLNPITVDQLKVPVNSKWLSISASAETYEPGSTIYLAVTTQPIIFGEAKVDKYGKAQITGKLPINALEAGAHTVRVVGTRELSGITVDKDGEIVLADETMKEIQRFDKGTQATIKMSGKNISGGNHYAIREVPLILIMPWWTIWIVGWTLFIAIVAKVFRKIQTKKEKIFSTILLIASALPALWLGWIRFSYPVMGAGALLAAIGVVVIWFLPAWGSYQKSNKEKSSINRSLEGLWTKLSPGK